MFDYKSIKCQTCNLFMVKHGNRVCSYCNTNKKHKTQQQLMYDYLKQLTLNFIYNKTVGFECGNFRPDFKIDMGSYIIIIEVDEDQHKQYDSNCELIRMNNIYLANGLPTIFIRFNPDLVNNINIPINKRFELLKSLINKYLNNYIITSNNGIELIYLYYDCECINNKCNFIHKKDFKL